MTWIIRNAFLALVAFATLAIMLMLALPVEATDLTPGYARARQEFKSACASSRAAFGPRSSPRGSARISPRTELPR